MPKPNIPSGPEKPFCTPYSTRFPSTSLKAGKMDGTGRQNLEMNRLRVANMLVSIWTSFRLLSGLSRFMASI